MCILLETIIVIITIIMYRMIGISHGNDDSCCVNLSISILCCMPAWYTKYMKLHAILIISPLFLVHHPLLSWMSIYLCIYFLQSTLIICSPFYQSGCMVGISAGINEKVLLHGLKIPWYVLFVNCFIVT